MPTPVHIVRQINDLIRFLIEVGLSNDQQFAFQRSLGGSHVETTFQGAHSVSIALRDREYLGIYQQLADARAYNTKLIDGALLQMMYEFDQGVLLRHRLAFFPAPHLEEFQNNPDIYLEDELYADVVARNIVPFPVRFDYDVNFRFVEDFVHPESHLTLGQYKNCRIPVTAPVAPAQFVDFVLRNFYHTAFTRYADQLPTFSDSFPETIKPRERSLVHVVVPR